MNTPSATSLLVPLRQGDNVVCLEVCLFSANNVNLTIVFAVKMLNLCYKCKHSCFITIKGCTHTTFLKTFLKNHRLKFLCHSILKLQRATYIRQVAVYFVKAFVGNEYVYFNGLVTFLVNNESIVVGVLLVDGDIALFTISANFFSVWEFAQQHCIGSTLCGV